MSREAQQLHDELMRESAEKQAGKSGDASKADNPSAPTKPVDEMSLDELTEAAERGNIDAMNRLRPMMQKNVSHYQTLGDIGANAIVKRLDVHCKENLFLRECLLKKLQAMVAAFLAEGDSAIEVLLINEVLLCWLRHQHWISLETLSIQSASCFKSLKFSSEQTRESQRMYLKALGKLQDYRNVKARLPSLANQDETESA